jgi:hypothetical protein
MPFNEEEPDGPARTKESYAYDSSVGSDLVDSNGVWGRCVLSQLSMYHPIENTNIDCMHSILEGVMKRFFKIWFEDPLQDNKCSLKSHMNLINKRLLSIRPPSYIPRAPRSVHTWHMWKAHEFLGFYLNLMEKSFFNNLTKFVVSMQILLSKKVEKFKLEQVQLILTDFVRETQHLYGRSVMLTGLHELLHLVKCSFDFGPLNAVNSFQFEEINRKITKFIKGRDLMGEEFLKIFTIYQSLELLREKNVKNKELSDFLDEYGQFKTSNRKKLNTNKPTKFNIIGPVEDNESHQLLSEFDSEIKKK